MTTPIENPQHLPATSSLTCIDTAYFSTTKRLRIDNSLESPIPPMFTAISAACELELECDKIGNNVHMTLAEKSQLPQDSKPVDVYVQASDGKVYGAIISLPASRVTEKSNCLRVSKNAGMTESDHDNVPALQIGSKKKPDALVETDNCNSDEELRFGELRKKIVSGNKLEKTPPETKERSKSRKRTDCPYRCPLCKHRFFQTKFECDIHLECHGDAGYHCPRCDYAAPSWNRILSHIVSHPEYRNQLRTTATAKNVIGTFPCPECGKIFERKVNMYGHFKSAHGVASIDDRRACEVCGRLFSGKRFARHLEKCRNVTLSCDQCSYRTAVASNMARHVRVHTESAFACAMCSARFPTCQRRETHELTHRADRTRYPCGDCDATFLAEDAVKKHVARFHSGATRSFACAYCDYVAKLTYDLRKHVRVVHEKKFRCPKCAYTTNSDRAFAQHEEYHSADRSHACPYDACFYRATTARQLAGHVASVHHVQSRHQCPICMKYFKKKTHLLRHLAVHTDERAYRCDECGESFYSHSSYYRHRNKSGHDAHRHGVASVPRNITIRYISDETASPETTSKETLLAMAESNARQVKSANIQSKSLVAAMGGNSSIQSKSVLAAMGGNSGLTSEMRSNDTIPRWVVRNPKEVISETICKIETDVDDGHTDVVTYLLQVEPSETGDNKTSYYMANEALVHEGEIDEEVIHNGEMKEYNPGGRGLIETLVKLAPTDSDDPNARPQYAIIMIPNDGL